MGTKITDFFKLDGIKKAHYELTKAIRHLDDLDPISISNARKRETRIPKLESERRAIQSEFDELAQSIKEWCTKLPEDAQIFAKIIETHYLDIEKMPSTLQDSIDAVDLASNASNVKTKILRLWIDSFMVS